MSPDDPAPEWALRGSGFRSVTRTSDELSIIAPESTAPPEVRCERGWRLLRFDGSFGFDLVGILASVVDPLRDAGVTLLAISTFDTDYVLVRDADVERASEALRVAGHEAVWSKIHTKDS